jgi:hypothetical protein
MTATTIDQPTSTRSWPAYLAVLAGGALLLHAVLVIGTGDEMSDAVVVTLYLGGMVVAIAAAIGMGVTARKGRRALIAIAFPVFLVVWAMGLGDLLTPLFEAFKDEEYVGDAGPIGLLGVFLIVLGLARSAGRS